MYDSFCVRHLIIISKTIQKDIFFQSDVIFFTLFPWFQGESRLSLYNVTRIMKSSYEK